MTGVGGNGVEGQATLAAGAGVLAKNTAGGDALRVAGKASFSRSGILTVAAGSTSAMKTGVPLSSASLVLATIQGNVIGVYVQGVTLFIGTSGSFTIHLNKAVPASTKVAWFAVN